VTDHLVLAGVAEASAAQALRLSARDKDESQEAIAASDLLKIELRDLDTQSQFDRLIAADLKFIPADFAEVMHVPTVDDVDALLARYRAGLAKQQRDLIVLLSVHPIPFSDDVWSWLGDLAREPEHELRGVLFRTLTLADAVRFGRMLAADGWSWDPKAHLWVNHYGTGALIQAEPALPFDQLAPRLAPWRVLEAARVRGADPAEVRLAAEIFGHVLAAEKIEEPDPGSALVVNRAEKDFPLFVVSVQPRPSPQEQGDPTASLWAAFDADARTKAYRRAIETATSRTEEARKLAFISRTLKPWIWSPSSSIASDMLDRWLEGCRGATTDFRRRARLAETAFLALCEALLIGDPARGPELWRAVRATMATRYTGTPTFWLRFSSMIFAAFRIRSFLGRR
jgi:hypothetical protein